jgi:hypothetical protein
VTDVTECGGVEAEELVEALSSLVKPAGVGVDVHRDGERVVQVWGSLATRACSTANA